MSSISLATPTASCVEDAIGVISNELTETVRALDPQEVAKAAGVVLGARRIYVAGAGRSGLSLRFTAMRLMHLGLSVCVVGDTTTPAIESGDVLIIASGSGTTRGMVAIGETAKKVGAHLVVLTTDASSPLAKLADEAIIVRAAGKQQVERAASKQYAGSLFEQAVLFVGDVMFHAIWQQNQIPTDVLWRRHANLE
ncbi:6-phospho-3-hexuloisomerase [Acidomonas methanolica]|uniref:6-phospho-3-hexuloisomerase n=2 Tax=Acidomonas methanolica TaxID=437 RepID=A0A023D546_ACIMT|nr:6-phospho-3-hexuloisomerase [Acidomonas methanolica]MBU2655458.1 6-phospho-3-hexuloisomerase [Acidomonas methanolica]MCQ9155749.1 6-phospho-3-hexuloisomerase [Acidomonas methanolica]TCS24444.1 6-phospho-3-hexuloisomerase [Acidomonas methanolica]BAN85797.1 6-phospho-3-hexulose isomerase (PHI) [Acidomonas methanolica]GAJ29257.1 6-phospho-3-hexuloisomerase [Acidomonas methanolica NBRC 104435]